jgi:hypothetical protein
MNIEKMLLTESNIEAFRKTFSTPEGKQVLDVILILGGYFNDDIKTDIETGKRNLCTKILKFMGVVEDGRSNEFVEAFTNTIAHISAKQRGGTEDVRTDE